MRAVSSNETRRKASNSRRDFGVRCAEHHDVNVVGFWGKCFQRAGFFQSRAEDAREGGLAPLVRASERIGTEVAVQANFRLVAAALPRSIATS